MESLYTRVSENKRIREVEEIITAIKGRLNASPDAVAGSKTTILDLGCGGGTSLVALRTLFPRADLYGVDNKYSFVEEARNHGIINKDSITCQDALTYLKERRNATVDLITVFEASPPLLPLSEIINEALRVLKPGGQVIISTWVDNIGVDLDGFEFFKFSSSSGSRFERNCYLLTKK